jgi:hypothetical protein
MGKKPREIKLRLFVDKGYLCTQSGNKCGIPLNYFSMFFYCKHG